MPHTTSRSVAAVKFSLYVCIFMLILLPSAVAVLQGQAKGAYKDAKHSL